MSAKKPIAKPPVDIEVVADGGPLLRPQRCENCFSWRPPQTEQSSYGTCHRGPGPVSTTVVLPPQVFDPNSKETTPIPVTYSGWGQTLPTEFCTTGWSDSSTIH